MRIENDGALITATDYWDSEQAAKGAVFLSVNAGALRVLIPSRAIQANKRTIQDLEAAKLVVLSRGPWPAVGLDDALELLADDGTDAPYAMHLPITAIDRIPPESEAGREMRVLVYVRGLHGAPSLAVERPGRWRGRVPELPWMYPWAKKKKRR